MGLLTPAQFGDFIEVLLDAYPVRLQLAQMLTTRLGRSLDAISVTGSLEGDAFQLIQTAEAQGWTLQLINATRESRPGNPKVIEFAQQFHLVSTEKRKPELELIIRESNGFLDVAAWRSALGEAEMRVCRIEVLRNSGGSSFGTGFLVGPSLVMTNYHVIKPVLDEDAKAQDVVLRFDFKRLEDGVTLNGGTVYRLDAPGGEGWLAACSPYSQVDLGAGQPGELPQPDELDFALLKVDGKPGNDRVGQVMEIDAPKRGFFTFPDPPVEIGPGEPLFILQHPEGDYLKLAIDTQAGLAKNGNGTRLRYMTNTLPGSSGSPCFNVNWKLVALHHAGDPSYSELNPPEFNQGIPIGAIRTFLQDRQLAGVLGG